MPSGEVRTRVLVVGPAEVTMTNSPRTPAQQMPFIVHEFVFGTAVPVQLWPLSVDRATLLLLLSPPLAMATNMPSLGE